MKWSMSSKNKLTRIGSPRPSRIDALAPWLEALATVIGGVAAGIFSTIVVTTLQGDDDMDGPGAMMMGMMVTPIIILSCVAVSTLLSYAMAKLLIAAYRCYYAWRHFPRPPKAFWSSVGFRYDNIHTNWDEPSEIKMNSV